MSRLLLMPALGGLLTLAAVHDAMLGAQQGPPAADRPRSTSLSWARKGSLRRVGSCASTATWPNSSHGLKSTVSFSITSP